MWTPEMTSFVQENWHKMTATEIGKIVKKTRNAVIGHANRVGLKKGEYLATLPPKPKKERKKKEYAKVTVFNIKFHKVSRRKPTFCTPVTDIKFLNDVGVPIWDLQSHHCRYIEEPSSLIFCGKQKEDGCSYCPEHAERIYIEMVKR